MLIKHVNTLLMLQRSSQCSTLALMSFCVCSLFWHRLMVISVMLVQFPAHKSVLCHANVGFCVGALVVTIGCRSLTWVVCGREMSNLYCMR